MTTHGELFAGIGGFGLGFDRAKMKTVWHVEIDKDCQDVLRKHFPESLILSDVREVGKHNLPTVDVISFGSPCQDLSIAGKRKGLIDGERSNLFFEAIRIVDELKPSFAVWENVPGAISSNSGRDFAQVLGAFRDIGARDIAWRIFDAQYFGVPQRRRRIFLVADFGGERAAEILFEQARGGRHIAKGKKAGEEIAGTIGRRTVTNHNQPEGVTAFTIQNNDGGNHKRADRPNGGMYVNETDKALTVGGTDLTAIVGIDVRNNTETGDIAITLQESGCKSLNAQPIIMSHGQANAGIVSDGEPSLTRNHEAPIVFPSIVSNGDSHSGFRDERGLLWQNRQQSNEIRIQKDTVPTMSKYWGEGGNNVPLVGVRRLTPTECERLQGFPDGWTDNQSDTQRYRQLGNAVAVPVVEWIGKRMAYVFNME